METAITITAAIAGAAWIAGEAWLCRRRLRAVEADAAQLYGMVVCLLDLQPGVRLDIAELEIERLKKAWVREHEALGETRLRVDRLDRARAFYPGHDVEAN